MDSGDVSNVVVLIDHDRHVVGETRSEKRQEKSKKCSEPLKSHRHVHIEL